MKNGNENILRMVCVWVISSLIVTGIVPSQWVSAQNVQNLSTDAGMVMASSAYLPMVIKGLKVYSDNPLLFDFIIDAGQSGFTAGSNVFHKETEKLVKYFLAALTIKENDLWVNLSPYERNRIITDDLGKTGLGKDMLEQDFILKQLTSSMIYPQSKLGRMFWRRVYARAREQFGTSDIPVDVFNKIWIVADKARVLERGQTAYVVKAHLKVMLEEDYKAARENGSENDQKSGMLAAEVIRQIIVPEIEKEVNYGRNFAPLRQMFFSMILAAWYKQTLKDAILNQVYSNQGKTSGVRADDPAIKEKIYSRYLEAYKKGVFDYIKEDTEEPFMPRRYFSGGEDFSMLTGLETTNNPAEADDMFFKDLMVLAKVFMRIDKGEEFSITYLSDMMIRGTRITVVREGIHQVPAEVIMAGISNAMDVGGGITMNLVSSVAPHFNDSFEQAEELLFPFSGKHRKFDVGEFFIVDLKGVETMAGWKYLLSFVLFDWSEENLREKSIVGAIKNVLQEADKLEAKSISVPSLGMGLIYVDSQVSARLMVAAIEQFLRENPQTGLKVINIVLDGEDSQEPFQKELDGLKRNIFISDGPGQRDAGMTGDSSMSEDPLGGIDLNSGNMTLDTVYEGEAVKMLSHSELMADFQRESFSGVTPVIVQILPVRNFSLE